MQAAPEHAMMSAMYKDRQITALIPCLRGISDIESVLPRVPSFVDEVIAVMEAKPSESSQGLPKELTGSRNVHVIYEQVHGSGRAYRAGLSQAKGDIIVALDADRFFPVDAISYLIEILLRSEVRFVSGSRFLLENRDAMSLKHRLGNRFLSFVFSLLYFRWVTDSQSGLWVFERSILGEIDLIGDMLELCEELKIEAIRNPKIGFMEVYLDFSSRSGEARLKPYRDGIQLLLFMLRKRFTPNRRTPVSGTLSPSQRTP
jgi:glycosyltransferase involved in cell wall biosynthesis